MKNHVSNPAKVSTFGPAHLLVSTLHEVYNLAVSSANGPFVFASAQSTCLPLFEERQWLVNAVTGLYRWGRTLPTEEDEELPGSSEPTLPTGLLGLPPGEPFSHIQLQFCWRRQSFHIIAIAHPIQVISGRPYLVSELPKEYFLKLPILRDIGRVEQSLTPSSEVVFQGLDDQECLPGT
jgi:hypothetical protein